MALNVRNKNFLGLLHKLGLDLNKFSDKSFDGMFDSVPGRIDHFFDWLLKNITPDNALTELEQALYYEAEKNHRLPTEDEVNYVLSSCDFTYEELQALDVNYINNSLSEELNDWNKSYEEFNDILLNLESTYSSIKKKNNDLNEALNTRKKQLIAATKSLSDANSSYNSKLDQVQAFLLSEPEIKIDLNYHQILLSVKNETSVLEYVKSFKNDITTSSNVSSLSLLKEDLACVETSLILSRGSLKEKKARIKFLSDLLLKKSPNRSVSDTSCQNLVQGHLMNQNRTPVKLVEDIKILEKELYEKVSLLSCYQTQKILDQYLLRKADLNLTYLSNLTTIRDYIKSNQSLDTWLLHLLVTSLTSLENKLQLKKELQAILVEDERNRICNSNNLEMRTQRFKTLSLRNNQHSLLLTLKNSLDIENPENNEESFTRVTELLSNSIDDPNFVTYKFRTSLKSSIKSIFDDVLCGPTSQLFFVPIDLIMKYHKSEERERDLSHKIKQLANKYLETKESISKTDRKKLISWISSLISSKS